jgi:hypothetical protein
MTDDRVIAYQLRHVDLLRADVDVVALKYAQGFHGPDRAVAEAMEAAGTPRRVFELQQWAHEVRPSDGAISAEHVMFTGVPPLARFSYEEIRRYAVQVLTTLAREMPDVSTIAMTLHGAGYGLDLVEAAMQQCLGVVDAITAGNYPEELQTVVVVEHRKYRLDEAAIAIEDVLGRVSAPQDWKPASQLEWPVYPVPPASSTRATSRRAIRTAVRDVAGEPDTKPSVFVAMPFDRTMRAEWKYGIKAPVRAAGFTCERMDEQHFTGEIITRMKQQIAGADLVIADLTGDNPNVFLEVGYAWGLGRPVLFLCRKVNGENPPLRFDVGGSRCLFYEDPVELEELITFEMKEPPVT